MDLFKNIGEKAKNTAKIVGEKSSDLVETGKYKMQISQLESDIKKAKIDIGQYFYDAYADGLDLPNDQIITLCEEIKDKYTEIEDIKEKIQEL